MSLEVWLNLIRQRFNPEDGQILVQSLQQDPLVWQFVQFDPLSLQYLDQAEDKLDAFTPGRIALWLVEQSTGIALGEVETAPINLPNEIKTRAVQTFETTFNTGLPPADLVSAGLLALTLIERRKRMQSWNGIAEEIFTQRNQQSLLKNYRIWRTPFACLLPFCPDFDDLAADFIDSKSEIITKTFLPISIHALLANPLSGEALLGRLFDQVKHLPIDFQLESLGWLRDFGREDMQVQLAKHLIQTKTNKDFFAQVFSTLEAFEAVNPDVDPLEKQVSFSLPEDLNRLAAFYYHSGNPSKANETYQKSNDILTFLKTQTLFQILAGDQGHVSSSRWLEVIKSVPHSKQARLFFATALIKEGQAEVARQHLQGLPDSFEKQLLQAKIQENQPEIKALFKSPLKIGKQSEEGRHAAPSYFVHPILLGSPAEVFNAIGKAVDLQTSLAWLEKYLQNHFYDTQAIKIARDGYEKAHLWEKSIELTAYLERLEPTVIAHKRDLARLYAQTQRWDDAFSFLQTLVKTDSDHDLEDLERFAEAALRTDHVEMAMSICHNIIKQDAHNPKALVLLGESYMHKGDVVKAIQHMEDVVRMIPDEPDGWITLASLWDQNDQKDRALETLKKGASAIPDSARLLRALGKAYSERQALQDALAALKSAYELEPDHTEGTLDLAQVYYQLGQPEKAYQHLENFAHSYQQNPNTARLLGHVLLAMNRPAEAEPVLLNAAESFPEDHKTVQSAVCLVLDRIESAPEADPQKDLSRVKGILKKARVHNPENFHVDLHLADIERLSGNYQSALDAYTKLSKSIMVEKSTATWRLQYGLGQAAIGLGNSEVGLAALNSALGIQPSNLIVRHALAEALQKADLPNKANTMAGSALKLAPQDLNNILWYARFKTNANEPQEAVRALKEALQITPDRDTLKLWLAKSLISAGSMEEAHEVIGDLITSEQPTPELLHQAAYICVHINDLDLAAIALVNALQKSPQAPISMLMDLAIIHSLNGDLKKALDTLEVDPQLMVENPQIALLKADLLSKLGQYDQALKALEIVGDVAEQALGTEGKTPPQASSSPLLYAYDLSLSGYQFRLGQLSRVLGDFDKALIYLDKARQLAPEDSKIKNAYLETAMAGLNFTAALKAVKPPDFANVPEDKIAQADVDLVCSMVETLLYQDENEQAAAFIKSIPPSYGANPRFLAIQSRLAVENGKIEAAKENLSRALETIDGRFGNQTALSLTALFTQVMTLHSIAEASIELEEHLQAIQTWQQINQQLETQPLLNWRYLLALVKGAEAQQKARTLAITTHSPGEICLSEQHYQTAEKLLQGLNSQLNQDQIICLKARVESAFTGKWPLHLNVDACLQGPEEAAAVLIGSEDKNLVQDILETYPDDVQVLQAYGIYAVRHYQRDALPYIEHLLHLDTANPVNHVLLAHMNLDQPEQALKSIETALVFWPDEPEWHALASELNAKLGNIQKAEEHIQYALEKQPENAGLWQTSAMLNAQKNDLFQAKSDLEKSTAYKPDDPHAWARMAEINRRMGNVSDAIVNIRQATQLNPSDPTLGEMEMQLLFEQKHFAELENKARETIAEDRTNQPAQIFLAQALAKQGKFDQALSVLKEARKQNPQHARYALEYLKIKKDQGGIEEVLPELAKLGQEHPEDAQVLTTLTDWLIQANRLDEAEEVAQTTLRILPEQAEVHLMLGRLQRVKGKLDQAIAHLSEAITLDSTLVDAYLELGKTYQERRDLEKAIEAYEKGTQANNSDPRPYYYAGLALKDCKDYQGAEWMLKQAKRYSPEDTNIIRQLGVVTALNLINNLREAQ
jgi:tetratricopeptide (TPR) repeat protein